MTRIKKIVIVAIVMILFALLVPTASVPQFMLASPSSPSYANENGVVVFVSDSKMNPPGDRLDVTLTVINKTGKRIYFRGQSPRFGSIFPYFLKDVDNDRGFSHCGNCWENHSMMSGFGTTFTSTLHAVEKRGRYGFTFGYNKSGPYDQVSWSEHVAFPDGAR